MKQNTIRWTPSLLVIFLGVVGCNSYKSKLTPPPTGELSAASIDYAFVNQQVFQPYCIRCHSDAGGNDGDINVENYESVVSDLDLIRDETLVRKSMPPKKAGGALPEYQQEILRMWVEAGAPRTAQASPEPTPEPTPTPTPTPTPIPNPDLPTEPEPVQPTWADISSKIFEPKCNKCHVEGGKAEEYPLQDKAYVVDPQNLMVVPGDLAQSPLVKAITREDNKRMPPARTGMTLTAQEIDAIKTWILNGAKD